MLHLLREGADACEPRTSWREGIFFLRHRGGSRNQLVFRNSDPVVESLRGREPVLRQGSVADVYEQQTTQNAKGIFHDDRSLRTSFETVQNAEPNGSLAQNGLVF